MSDYKLVPVEPTAEMLSAVDDEAEDKYLARGRAISAYHAMLAAAPDVQGEPVAWRYRMLSEDWEAIRPSHPSTFHPDHEKLIIEPLYTAPQPAEQQSCPVCKGCGLNPLTEVPVACANCHGVTPAEQKPALFTDMANQDNWLPGDLVICVDQEGTEFLNNGDTYTVAKNFFDGSLMIKGFGIYFSRQFRFVSRPSTHRKQQPAPDVAGLLGLLEYAQCPNCDGSGARYGGHGEPEQCQWCHERDAALAAHRKGGE